MRAGRWLLWALAVSLAAVALARLVLVSADQLGAPFDLAWESPGLRTIQLFQEGRDPYDPAVYAAPPFWLSPYTPLYPRLVASLPADPGNPFFTGRLVALGAALLAAASLLVVGGRAVPLSLLALAAYFLVRPAVLTAAYLRGDALALLLSVLVLLAARRAARGRRLWLAAAALAGAAAFWTKQNFVAAPAAAALWLLLVDRRRALTFVVLYSAFLAAPLAWWWSDGFRFSVFESLQNPLELEQITGWWWIMATQPVFDLLVAWSVAAALLVAVRRRWDGLRRAPFALYALTAAAVHFATIGKAGSWLNYFLEPALACLLVLLEAGRQRWADADAAGAPRPLATPLLAAVLLLASAVVELGWQPGADVPARFIDAPGRAYRQEQLAFVADAIRGLGVEQPLILNVYDVTMTYPLPGTICASDPYHYFLLYEAGRLSTGPVVTALEARDFDGVFTAAGLIDSPAPDSPMGALHRALQQHYHLALPLGPMDYLVPKRPKS